MKKFGKTIITVAVIAGLLYAGGTHLINKANDLIDRVEETPELSAKGVAGTAARSFVRSLTDVAPVVIDVESIICRESILDVAELAVVEEHYNGVYVYKKPNDRTQFLNLELFGTHATYVFTYEGYFNAGIRDVEACDYEADQEAQIITVTIPEVEILHCDVDENSIEEVLYDTGVFADLEPEDMTDMLGICHGELEEAAEDSDILERAHDRVEALMRRSVLDMISGTPIEEYTVEIVFAEEA